MFALILVVLSSGNVSSDRLPEVDLSFKVSTPVIVRDSLHIQPPKQVTIDDMQKVGKTKIAEKMNPNWVVVF